MEVVIKIPDEGYDWIKNGFPDDEDKEFLIKAVKDGTPLPKGHGRIGDLDAVMDDINRSINEMTNIGIAIDGEYLWGKLNDAIDNAETIIPAESKEV